MEVISFEEFVSSGLPYIFFVAAIILAIAIRWFINEVNGTNDYKRYPVTKVMDEMAKTGELKGKNITDAIVNIDHNLTKDEQVIRFQENIRSQ